MQYPKATLVLLLAEFFSQASAAAVGHGKDRRNIDENMAFKRAANSTSDSSLSLDPNLVQTGSEIDGTPTPGEAASAISFNNFINFCEGQTLTNGLQNPAGSCNGIPMGKIPAEAQTVSTIILSPEPGETIPANQPFNVTLQVANLQAGSFTNSANTYYSVPQDLNEQGEIVGHVHVTIQTLGNSLTPTTAPDPTTFAFFLGIDGAGNGEGLLSAFVTTGLPAGFYRACTLASSSNHQPVLSAIAKRGAQDDCTKFIVSDSASSASASSAPESSAVASASAVETSAVASASAVESSAVASASAVETSAVASASAVESSVVASATVAESSSEATATESASSASIAVVEAASTTTSLASIATTAVASIATTSTTSASETTSTEKPSSPGKPSSPHEPAPKKPSPPKERACAIGNINPPAVGTTRNRNRPFEVEGATFARKSAAVQRACAIQNKECVNAVESRRLRGFTVRECDQQEQDCNRGVCFLR